MRSIAGKHKSTDGTGKSLEPPIQLPVLQDRELSTAVQEAIQKTVRAAQLFGSASGRRADLPTCKQRMEALQKELEILVESVKSELSKRYQAGLELGRGQPK